MIFASHAIPGQARNDRSMKTLLTLGLLIGAFTANAQKEIWSHAIGNWRNGPVVYITELIQVTEAYTTPELLKIYKRDFAFPESVTDIDVLRFGTPEEGEESIRTLKAKYGVRKLEVEILEIPAIDGP